MHAEIVAKQTCFTSIFRFTPEKCKRRGWYVFCSTWRKPDSAPPSKILKQTLAITINSNGELFIKVVVSLLSYHSSGREFRSLSGLKFGSKFVSACTSSQVSCIECGTEHCRWEADTQRRGLLTKISYDEIRKMISLALNTHGAWWRIGWVDAFRPKGHGIDYLSSRLVGTLGKSFTHSWLCRFGVKFRLCIRAVSGAPRSSSVLEKGLYK